jgi:Mrp family chromosome partitioning ATPase
MVALGEASMDDALVWVSLEPFSALANGAGLDQQHSPNGRGKTQGSLAVLPAGVLPPDPGEFVASEGIHRTLDELRRRFDVVLIDSPPLLAVGDGLTVGSLTDAIVVTVMADRARRPTAMELGSILARMPAAKLGFVLTGDVSAEAHPYYGYGYREARPSRAQGEQARV